jgi:hypothetical protein
VAAAWAGEVPTQASRTDSDEAANNDFRRESRTLAIMRVPTFNWYALPPFAYNKARERDTRPHSRKRRAVVRGPQRRGNPLFAFP